MICTVQCLELLNVKVYKYVGMYTSLNITDGVYVYMYYEKENWF